MPERMLFEIMKFCVVLACHSRSIAQLKHISYKQQLFKQSNSRVRISVGVMVSMAGESATLY